MCASTSSTFRPRPLTGNPLSLVPEADGLAEPQMRAIAREFNQSETTFLLRPSLPGATWRLRSFTPIGAEVFGAATTRWGPGCGWPPPDLASGTAAEGPGLAQEIGGEVLAVEVTRAEGSPATVWMDQSPPRFGTPVRDRAGLATSLGLTEGDLVPGEAALVVSTGAGHLLVPLRDRGTVDRADPDARRLAAALRGAGGEGCYLYSRDPVDAAARSPTPGSSTRSWASAKTRRREPRPGRWSPAWSPPGAGRRQLPPSWSRATRSDGPAAIQVTVSGPRVRVGGSGLVVAEGALTI